MARLDIHNLLGHSCPVKDNNICTQLYTSTTNGLALLVAEQAVEQLRQEHLKSLERRRCAVGRSKCGNPICPPEEFIRKFLDGIQPGQGESCWLWIKGRNKSGYGMMKCGEHMVGTHRIMWFLTHGSFPPKGLCVCHQCDTPACVNFSHFFLGTNVENIQDAARKGRMHLGERHGMSRLTVSQVLAINSEYSYGTHGSTIEDLASKYNVGRTTIHHILNGDSWSWLTHRSRTQQATL
jgi:hypothetical protein